MMSKLIQGYEVVIGFETHTQLATSSKIFSRASTAFGAEPNTQAAPVDLALPGTLPVMNKGAVECAIKLGLALGSTIAEKSIFARKNYFYPDLPKGYQISQFEIPVVQGGSVEFFLGEQPKTVHLVRAHLEEDAGKSLHEDFIGQSGIDLNRAGTPLLEIVTEPDMHSSDEAVAYAKELHKIVTWIGICDGNMQEGSFRCDANVSVHKPNTPLGTRREIKNLNSFKFMQQAIDFEIRWQIEQIEDGKKIQQATVLFDPDTGETRAMRTKEDAADYRYFPDPDLPPLHVAPSWVNQVKATMPELPRVMAARFVSEYGLPEYDANQLTQSQAMAAYFEDAAKACGQSKLASNWVMGEISRRLNQDEKTFEQCPVSAVCLGELLNRVHASSINVQAARTLLDRLWSGELKYDNGRFILELEGHGSITKSLLMGDLIVELGLGQINDSGALEKIIEEVLAANPDNVAQFKAGKDKAFNALVGQAMKASKGKANPQQVNDMLRSKLGA
ncbi:MAG: Asp-tRNA(Asn)/Glu-tRNA(Gln) amidotransferase subunit GatB [Burkholderiales bacterium]|nr:MAG: Asp-tRNA(Asn)/Glu-tRNA(Gln) amidotransferase subunit GatB [Burkholderiales bacterium]